MPTKDTGSRKAQSKSPTPEKKRSGQRKRYTKTKFGCKTCKIRKVRCDETWPTCNNCLKGGRICAGVPHPHDDAASNVTFIKPLTLSHFEPTQIPGLGPEELLCLDKFRHDTIRCVIGEFERPSWRRLVLQATYSQPAMCYAVVAFTALRNAQEEAARAMSPWNPEAATCSSPAVRLALRSYGRCLSKLQAITETEGESSINLVLLCNLLCICFEVVMKSSDLALGHLQHSLQIVSSNITNIDADIIETYNRLDVQACTYLTCRQPALPQPQLKSVDALVKSSFEDADAEITSLLSSILTFIRVEVDNRKKQGTELMTVTLMRTKSELEAALAMFQVQRLSTEALLLQHTPMTATEEAFLRLRYLTAKVHLGTCLEADETAFGAYNNEFMGMTNAAATLLDNATPQEPRPRPSYCLEAGVVHPMFLTASKCRDFMIRRHAITLLEQAPEVEGLWATDSIAQTAERTVEADEMSSCSEPTYADIPAWCRVQEAQSERMGNMAFRQIPNGLVNGESVDFIQW